MTIGGRRALFFIAAIAANVFATGALFALFLLVYDLTLARLLPSVSSAIAMILAFLAAVLVSSLCYGRFLDWARKRWRLEERLGLGRPKPR